MYTWIGIRNKPLWQKGVRKRLINTPKHPLHLPLSLKMEVLHRCFENGEEVQKLKAQMQDMQMEIDILKETLNVLKKDPGVDITVLKNREKAAIVDAVKAKCRLPILLGKFHMARSSYYYQHALSNRRHVRNGLTGKIKELFIQNKGRYGYRRIHALLKRIGIIVSDVRVRQK